MSEPENTPTVDEESNEDSANTAVSEHEDQLVDAQFAEDLDDDIWVEAPGPSLITRMFAEAGGSFALILVGLGTMLFAPITNNGSLTVALAFAVGLIIAIVIFGNTSGAHVNPAVTVGLWLSGRFPGMDVIAYVISQIIGGIAAGAVLLLLIGSHPGISETTALMSAAATGYGENSPVGFGLAAALVVEVVLAAILVAVVLAATSSRTKERTASAPLVIGLTYGFLMLVAIPFTNGALNPVRSTAIALFADSWALQQLWVFWLAPLVGAAIAGLLFRAFGPEEDLIIVEQFD